MLSDVVMPELKILVVEDEAAVRGMVRFALEQAGFGVVEAPSAMAAQERIAESRPQLILMDWMLPDMAGVDLTKRLKKDEYSRDIPVIMLTAKGEVDDRVKGLEAGADDYVPKPFSPRELVARIRAVLRRTVGDELETSLSLGGVTLDDDTHRVMVDDRELDMGPTEFRLLRFFLANPERVFSREQILDYVWGRNSFLEERTVDVHIRRLRKALEAAGKDMLIQTVRGVGYRCSDRPTPA